MNDKLVKWVVAILVPLLQALPLFGTIPILDWALNSYFLLFVLPLIVGVIISLITKNPEFKAVGKGLIIGSVFSLTIVIGLFILLLIYWPK